MALLTSGFAQKVLGVQVKKMFQPLGFFSGLSLIGRREIMVAQSIFWTSTLNPALRRFAAFTLTRAVTNAWSVGFIMTTRSPL